jgi:hypothetical protein
MQNLLFALVKVLASGMVRIKLTFSRWQIEMALQAIRLPGPLGLVPKFAVESLIRNARLESRLPFPHIAQ